MIYKYNLGRPCDCPQSARVVATSGEYVKKFLTVQLQDNNAVLWAEVDKDSSGDDYFTVIPVWTGFEEPLDKNAEYIGTIQEPQTGLVYHYYGIK